MPGSLPRLAEPEPPGPITPEDVRRWLADAERTAHELRRRAPPRDKREVARWPDLFVSDHDTRQYLKAWIWCEAHGESFAEMCRSREGWSVRTGTRRVTDAIRLITAGLNAGFGSLPATIDDLRRN